LTKEKAKKEQAVKKGASPKKDQVKKGEKKRKARAIKKRKAPWGAYLKGFSAEPMSYDIRPNEQSLSYHLSLGVEEVRRRLCNIKKAGGKMSPANHS